MNKMTICALLIFLAVAPLGISVAKDAGAYRDATPGQQRDAKITAAVNTKLTSDEVLRGRAIAVQTQNGIVSLGGFVRSEAEQKTAVELARSVDAVISVDSNLKIDTTDTADSNSVNTQDSSSVNTLPSGSINIQNRNPVNTQNRAAIKTVAETPEGTAEKTGTAIEQSADTIGKKVVDATITSEIKVKFAADSLVKASDIDVDTKDNRVTLTGTVSSKSERDRAVRIARSVKGVRAVRSILIVRKKQN